MALKDWSTTSADNNDADGDIDLEGSTASIRTADNSMRAIMGKMAIWRDDNNGSRSTAGSSNTYTYASAGSAATPADAFAAYATGDTLTIQANHTNTGAATLNVDSVGAKAIRKYIGGAEAALDANDIISDSIIKLVYDAAANSAAGAWILLNPAIVRGSVLATQVSISGLGSTDFTIPSWANNVDVSFFNVSGNGTASMIVRLGDSGGVETTSYSGAISVSGTIGNKTDGFYFADSPTAASALHGIMHIRRLDSTGLSWVANSIASFSTAGAQHVYSGSKQVSAQLTTVQVYISSGSFDSGTVTVTYW